MSPPLMTRAILIRQLRERAAALDAEWLPAFWDVTAENVPEYEALDDGPPLATLDPGLKETILLFLESAKRLNGTLKGSVHASIAYELAKRSPEAQQFYIDNGGIA